MMHVKIILIGSTGFVGSHILDEALERGHEVHAVLRDINKMTKTHPNLSLIKADVMEEIELQDIFSSGYDAVISAYNPGWSNPDIYNDFITGYKSILNALKGSGLKRIILIGGAGSLLVNGSKLIDDEKFPKAIYNGAKAASDLLDILHNEDSLDWTMISPAINLVDDKRTNKFKIAKDSPVFNSDNESVISVQDLAAAAINELEKPEHIRERFTLGN
jgi:putative NADH-flavin reductase